MNTIDQKKFRHYLDHSYKISQDYKDWRRIYLEINIGFTSFFSLGLNFIIQPFGFTGCAELTLYIGFLILLFFTSINIIFNLVAHGTKNTEGTWYHYRHHFNIIKKKHKKISCADFKKYCLERNARDKIKLKDDWRALFNLYKTQANYFKLLKTTRILTLISLTVFFFVLFIGIFIHAFSIPVVC